MINTSLNDEDAIKKQNGSILVSVILVILISSIIISSTAPTIIANQRVVANSLYEKQAFENANSGLEFAQMYGKVNLSSIITDNDNDGLISQVYNTSNYIITYTNPIVSNFNLLNVTSVGKSDNGNVTQTAVQRLYRSNFLSSKPAAGLIAKGSVTLSGNVSTTNTETGKTIWSGGSVTLSGSSATIGVGGVSSNKHGINSDVTQNSTALSSLTDTQFFNNFFNKTKAVVKATADLSYTNTTNTNYSDSLSGVLGKVIYITQTSGTAALNSTITIGSAAQPVILVIDGDLKVNGNVTLYGMIYVANNWSQTGGGTLSVEGAVVVQGNIANNGTPNIAFKGAILNTLQNNFVDLAKVPGSWRDF